MTSADERRASTGTPRTQMLSTEEAERVGDEAGMPRFIAQNGLFRTMLVHEPIATAMWGMVRALLRKGELDPHVRELVIMRVAWRTGTAYEWAQHWRASELAGVGADKLEAVRDWRTSVLFSSAEAAALEATDDVLDSGTVGSSTWEACTRAFPSERDRVEMVSVIAIYQMVAVLLRSLQIPLDDDLDVWPPDGHEPGTQS